MEENRGNVSTLTWTEILDALRDAPTPEIRREAARRLYDEAYVAAREYCQHWRCGLEIEEIASELVLEALGDGRHALAAKWAQSPRCCGAGFISGYVTHSISRITTRHAEQEKRRRCHEREAGSRVRRNAEEQPESSLARIIRHLLSKQDYDLLRLRYVQQWSIEEIAEEAHLSRGAVRTRLHRAKKRLCQTADSPLRTGRWFPPSPE